MMNAETLRNLLRAVPFVPFRLHTSSGQQFEIRSPEWMMVGKSISAVFVPGTDDLTLVSNLHVNSIVPLKPNEVNP